MHAHKAKYQQIITTHHTAHSTRTAQHSTRTLFTVHRQQYFAKPGDLGRIAKKGKGDGVTPYLSQSDSDNSFEAATVREGRRGHLMLLSLFMIECRQTLRWTAHIHQCECIHLTITLGVKNAVEQ